MEQRPVMEAQRPLVVRTDASATFSIQPPECFDFTKPQEWDKWIRRFERFRVASNLNVSSEEKQINTLIYCMGDEADDVLRGIEVAEADRGTYKGVSDAFQTYFVVTKNTIYERAKFNMRMQNEGESVDSFVTALYALAEHCQYGLLRDELIRDRIVVGLRDVRLSERMQLDAKLTLKSAIDQARQSEVVKRQQVTLRGTGSEANESKSVDRVYKGSDKAKSRGKPPSSSGRAMMQNTRVSKGSQCWKCGGSAPHAPRDCPANDVKCHNCGKRGHFSRVCMSKNVHEVAEEYEEEEVFLGSVTAKGEPWMVDIDINERQVPFKIDTGADVTVLPHSVFKELFKDTHLPTLSPSSKPLLGPGRNQLDVVGVTKLLLKRGDKSAEEEVYVINHLHTALLGRPAISKLELVARLDSISIETLKSSYPKLCSGLGEVRQPYAIRLKPGAEPYSLKTPRRVPLPLMDKVQQELSRMESLGVISRVEEPTDWCAGIVVKPKKNGTVRICVDLTKLSESVCREKYILPSVEETLGNMDGAQVFSKLDANMSKCQFWMPILANTPDGGLCEIHHIYNPIRPLPL